MFSNNLELVMKEYEDEENSLRIRLQQLSKNEVHSNLDEGECSGQHLNKQEKKSHKSAQTMKQRNAQILKEIEMSRAKIRSLSLYSPLESILQRAISDYVQSIEQQSNIDSKS